MRAYVRHRERRAFEAVTVLRLSRELHDWPAFRVTVHPSAANGLRRSPQVTIDRAAFLPREKIGAIIGRLDDNTMQTVGRTLAVFLGLEEGPA